MRICNNIFKNLCKCHLVRTTVWQISTYFLSPDPLQTMLPNFGQVFPLTKLSKVSVQMMNRENDIIIPRASELFCYIICFV